MRYLTLFLTGFMLGFIAVTEGCGRAPNEIDPAFKPMYQEFIDDSKTYGDPLEYNQGMVIQFGVLGQTDNNGTQVGECDGAGYGNGVIVIDRNFWAEANDAMKHVLFFHELGHCVLARKHSGNDLSIMYPTINEPASYWDVAKDQMLKELFNNRGN